jgi:RNA recognition motif. (a.k.a. RRM, RBD, or RNP domain)
MRSKLFIGNLNYETTTEKLETVLRPFPGFAHAKVCWHCRLWPQYTQIAGAETSSIFVGISVCVFTVPRIRRRCGRGVHRTCLSRGHEVC